jgi:hypothetical protein
MRRLLLPCLLLPLQACAPDPGGDDGKVRWTGDLLDGPYVEGTSALGGATIDALDLDGVLLDASTEHDPDSHPGRHRLHLPPDTPLALHVRAPGVYPTLYRATSPRGDAWWLSGTLFAWNLEKWSDYFEQFSMPAHPVGELGPDRCWLFGYPDDPEAWVDPEILVLDGEGTQARVRVLTSEDGDVVPAGPSDPVHEFLAFDLAAGDILLSVTWPDGRAFETLYPGCSGEIANAWFLARPVE